jgi:hypothetical protein
MVKSPQPQAYVGSSFSGSFSSSSSSSSKIPDLKIMDLPLPMNDKSSGHASTIGFKLMQLDPSNPKSKYRDVLYSEKNDNSFKAGFTRRDDTIERYNTGGPIEFDALTEPRNHSEPNALTDIMKSLETSIRNHIPNNQTTLLNSLQRPYRAKIYIRNSKYPPCVTKYGNYVGTKIENQRGAPCDSYIEAQRRSLIGKYHGVDFRIKIGNQGSGPILGGYVEPGIRRYGYGEGKDGFNMKKDKDKNWLNYIG